MTITSQNCCTCRQRRILPDQAIVVSYRLSDGYREWWNDENPYTTYSQVVIDGGYVQVCPVNYGIKYNLLDGRKTLQTEDITSVWSPNSASTIAMTDKLTDSLEYGVVVAAGGSTYCVRCNWLDGTMASSSSTASTWAALPNYLCHVSGDNIDVQRPTSGNQSIVRFNSDGSVTDPFILATGTGVSPIGDFYPLTDTYCHTQLVNTSTAFKVVFWNKSDGSKYAEYTVNGHKGYQPTYSTVSAYGDYYATISEDTDQGAGIYCTLWNKDGKVWSVLTSLSGPVTNFVITTDGCVYAYYDGNYNPASPTYPVLYKYESGSEAWSHTFPEVNRFLVQVMSANADYLVTSTSEISGRGVSRFSIDDGSLLWTSRATGIYGFISGAFSATHFVATVPRGYLA